MATVPVISPEGTFGSVPQDNLNTAIQRGFKTATAVVSPEGQDGWLPMDKVHEAVGRGFKIGTSAQLAQEQAPQSGPVDTALREGVLGAASGAGLPESTNRSDFSLVPGLKQIFTHPIDSAKLLGGAVIDAGQQQQDALNKAKQAGATYPALVHAVAAGIPLVGPVAENAGEEIGRGIQAGDVGQIAHGFGSGAGLVGTLAAGTEKGSQLANEAITEVGSNVAKPIIATARRIPETIQNVKQVLNPVKNMTAEQAATKAIRPRNSKSNFPQELQTALPDARRAADTLGINPQTMTMDDALNAVNQAKKDVWGEYQNNYSDPNAAVTVDTSPVADAMRKTVSQRMTEQNPGLAKKINWAADTYDGRDLSVQDLEDRVQELNRQTRAIEAKYTVDKRAAKMSPNNAPVFAERDGLRQLLLDKMGENAPDFATDNPEASAAALRQRYGNLMSVEDSLSRRLPVANRQSPKGLTDILSDIYGPAQVAKGLAQMATGVGAIHGLANVIEGGVGMKMAKNAKLMNSPDFLIQQAFSKSKARPPATLRTIHNGEYMPQEGDASQFTPGYQGNQLPSGQPRVDQLPAGQYPAQPSPLGAIFRPRQPQLQKAPSVPASRQLPAKNPIPLGPSGTSGVTNIEPVNLPFLRGNSVVAPEGQAVAKAITKGAKPKQFAQPGTSTKPEPAAPSGQTGNGFLDLLNKAVSNTKRDAGLDETISRAGFVPRGFDPASGQYAFEVPTKGGGLTQKLMPAGQITPEAMQKLKPNGGNVTAPGIDRAPGLTPEQRAAEDKAIAYTKQNYPHIISDYLKKNTQHGTTYVVADRAKDMLPGFQSIEERSQNAIAIHNASAAIADSVWDQAMKQPVNPNKPEALIITGVPGIGKTASYESAGALNNVGVLYEKSLSSPKTADRLISDALASGRKPVVNFVYADDPRIALHRAVTRAERQGRTVPIGEMARTYASVPQTLLEMKAKYGDAVDIRPYNNTSERPTAPDSNLDSLERISHNWTVQSTRRALADELNRLHSEGKVSERVYRGFLGEDPEGDGPSTGGRPQASSGSQAQGALRPSGEAARGDAATRQGKPAPKQVTDKPMSRNISPLPWMRQRVNG